MPQLTNQEELFLAALFDTELNPSMDADIAKEAAGYSSSTSAISIMRKLKSQLQDDVQNYFLSIAPKAARKVASFIDDDNPIPGSEKVLSAAIQVLDRAGITKPDKQEVEVKIPIGFVALPPINYNDENCIDHSEIERTITPQIGNGKVVTEADI